VDILIPTIGRPSLPNAMMAAASQTWPDVRVVVLADGPGVKGLWAETARGAMFANTIYREMPDGPAGHGNALKSWWLHGDEAAPFVRVLDDDDWIPPRAVELMMAAMAEDVSLVLCRMARWTPPTADRPGRLHICRPVMAAHHATTGTMLMRTTAVKAAEEYDPKRDDWSRAQALARVGRVAIVDACLYWCDRSPTRKVRSRLRAKRFKLLAAADVAKRRHNVARAAVLRAEAQKLETEEFYA
jgi:glycosyltransferase involved in cell wall biosynthesis